jgi:hypothetical protein
MPYDTIEHILLDQGEHIPRWYTYKAHRHSETSEKEYTSMEVAGVNPIFVIIIGLLLLGLVFRLIKGVIRLVLTVGIIAVLAYIVLNYAR